MNAMRSLLGLVVLMFVAPFADAQWGTIKGRVIFEGDAPVRPVIAKAAANPDCAACAVKGITLEEEWVVDPKTKGVRWVIVWLQHESGDFDKKFPIHPKLAKADEKVFLDQPCCQFEPHALGMRTGQILVAKNSSKFGHNVNIIGGTDNPNKNVAVGSGMAMEIPGWNASPSTVPVQCNIHGWMRANIRVFDHPYFAVTNEKGEFEIKDAPAGMFRLVLLHDSGYVTGGKKGIPVEIKAGGTTDLGDVKAKQ